MMERNLNVHSQHILGPGKGYGSFLMFELSNYLWSCLFEVLLNFMLS